MHTTRGLRWAAAAAALLVIPAPVVVAPERGQASARNAAQRSPAARAEGNTASARNAAQRSPAARAEGNTASPRPRPGWKQRWAPEAARDGLRAFEHVEEDRANSHPAGQPHIRVEGNNYRFTMHTVDLDTSTDRQRQEVRGLRAAGETVTMLKGETWRITYAMFIPDTLKATTTFHHIMQTKAPGTGTGPMVVMSLRRYGMVPKIEVRLPESGNGLVGVVDLEPLQNRWVDVELQMKIGDAPDGWVRWILRDGPTTVIDTTATGVDNWLVDRVRMKWGIYRSLRDTSGSLQDAHMLITRLRAYQRSDAVFPPLRWRAEAEQAVIRQGSVESGNGNYTGTGYVNLDDAAGASVEWTVLARRAGPATLNLWYANAEAVDRPMDVTVNGVLVADDLVFGRTPAWNDWETRTLLTALREGANTIRATATGAVGGPNLDSVEVEQPFVP
jgi:hypothetical protein